MPSDEHGFDLDLAVGEFDRIARPALLGNLALTASLWAIASYLYFMLEVSLPGETIGFLVSLAHPLRFLYAVSLILVGLTVTLPTYFILQSEKFLGFIKGLFERLSLLTLFYLFFDVVGLVIVIVRNI